MGSDTANGTQESALLASIDAAGEGGVARRVFRGMTLPVRAVRFLLGRPKLWGYVAIPAVINVILFVGSLFLLGSYMGSWMEYVWAEPTVQAWYDWGLKGLWYGAIAVMTLLISYVVVIAIGGILASPFNDALSERVEEMLLPEHRRREADDDGLFKEVVRSIGASGAIMGAYCVIMGFLLLLNVIPVVGQIAATVGGGLISALFLTLEFTDATLDRRGHRLSEKLGLIRSNRALSLGFGVGSSLLMCVPLLNVLTIPVAVVGGTALGVAFDETEGD